MDEGPLIAVQPTVLVVDDHEAFRSSASALLSAGGLHVLDAAADGAAGVRLVALLRPDIVVLDVRLPDATGFSVADTLARLPHPPAVVLVSSLDPAEVVPRIDRATVCGFIPKSELTPQRVRDLVEFAT